MKPANGYVLLPQSIREEAVKMLDERGLEVVQAHDPKPSIVAPLMKDAKAIILRTGIDMTAELMDKADDLWTISRTGGGVDNVDLEAATERGIIVTSSLGVNTTTVAEHGLALILGLYKQLFQLDREVKKNNFRIRYQNLPQDIFGKRLGVVGFGKIGQTLADYFYKLSKTKILAFDPLLSDEIKKANEEWVEFVDLEELLQQSDVVSIHVPLNKHTRDLVSWKQLNLMKREAFIINVSRGGVINEKDLIRALQEDVIKGAGLDVFESEPIEEQNPLLMMDNVILTPHSAALTGECVIRMATEAVKRAITLFDGYQPEKVANPAVLNQERWQHLKKKRD